MPFNKSTDVLIQNLKDAGCNSETIKSIVADFTAGEEEKCLKQLAVHRKKLLDSIHKEQKCIDCLDYLVYRLEEDKETAAI
ncbi:MAG: hypothetical protein LUI05_08730 [Oscillospiraceae bacterium]|nr:hypothetical protein [Oscillospiraceae bacterium]